MMEGEIIHDPRSIMLLPSNDPRRVRFEAAVAEQLRVDRQKHAARLAAEPVRSAADCRAALRAAVEKHADLTQRLAELTKALPKAESAVFAARSGVEQAGAALEDAKREASSQAVAAAVGKTSGTPPSIAKARRVLEAAQDDLEVAKTAAADLAKQHKAVEQALSPARMGLSDAKAAVIRTAPEVKALIEARECVRRVFADLDQAVELVAGYFPYAERLALTSDGIDDGPPSAKRREWEMALAALETNADAELPV
jgi:hypothetical protein